jgi:Flp pilus assembly protein TadG
VLFVMLLQKVRKRAAAEAAAATAHADADAAAAAAGTLVASFIQQTVPFNRCISRLSTLYQQGTLELHMRPDWASAFQRVCVCGPFGLAFHTVT